MLEGKGYEKELEKILEKQEHIVYKECDLYLVDEACLNKVLLLEGKINRNAKNEGFAEKRSAFYHFGKIINPDYPAVKYNLKKRHKYRATYDREKILKEIDRDKSIIANLLRKNLEEEIAANKDGKYDGEKAEKARRELDDRIEIDIKMLDNVKAHFDDYEIVITNYENYTIYPYIYFTYNDEKRIGLGKNEHLREKVPNILWYSPDNYYANRRTDETINKMVQTYTRLLGTIYVKKKDKK